MRRRMADALRTAVATVQPPPRVVDWSILAVVCFEALSGLASFTVGTSDWWPLFWAHRVAGLTLVALLGFKLARVRDRLTDRDRWLPSTPLSVLTLLVAIGSLATGILWVAGLDVRLSYWTLLSVHVGLGLLLVPLVLAHLSTRFRLPRRADFEGRRRTIEFTALLTGGFLVYRGQELLARVLDWAGTDRRFTGSQPRTGAGNDGFPVTAWVADDPDPIDSADWTLNVRGEVGTPLSLGAGDVAGAAAADRHALLDCTSGWYTIQRWGGVRVGDLLAAADARDEAEYVRFVSVTGYRWSLPIEEARDALLATHVGGERLSHGHGAPARLVAPGRRGFQWVKWVVRVDVRRRRDPAQWVVTLVSGFD